MLDYALALLVSFLPARHWPRFSALPVDRAAPVASVAAVIAGAMFGIAGFMRFANDVMRDTGRLQIAIAERQMTGALPDDAVVSSGPMAVAMLAPLTFLLFTPTGQVAGYVMFSSLARTLSWIVDRPIGDPALTILDHAFCAARDRTSAAHRRRRRERNEGPDVADRLYPGTWAGLNDADFVVVASRRKPDWRVGATVMTRDDECFRIGEPFDLQTGDGLRTIYPLSRQRLTEVVRHAIPYQLPRLRPR